MNHNERTIEKFAKDKLVELGFSPDQFKWTNRRTEGGDCVFIDGKFSHITVSKQLLHVKGVEFSRDVVLHELAHAKAGIDVGHGPEWQEWAVKLGAMPEECYNLNEGEWYTLSKYVAKCSNGCDYRHYFNRMGRKWQRGGYCCSKCGGDLNVATL